jgi:hypothetical protein
MAGFEGMEQSLVDPATYEPELARDDKNVQNVQAKCGRIEANEGALEGHRGVATAMFEAAFFVA